MDRYTDNLTTVMPRGDISIVFDVGATNVRVVAIDSSGGIVASASEPNVTHPDPSCPAHRIWDFYEIWNKLCRASNRVMIQIDSKRIAGVTVTTFGVDGTFFDHSGRMLHPVISWQCERTRAILENISRYITTERLYGISGVLPFYFNTITRLIWFRENHPEMTDNAKVFLYGPSIIGYFLSGVMVNDITMAGTSMTTSLKTRQYCGEVYDAIGLSADIMGATVEPGTVTGSVTFGAAAATGIPEGTSVVATGHDTQFALFGSGAGMNTPVLSSGTWEILMVRSPSALAGPEQLAMEITTELDPVPGMFDIGNQWVASGLLEWIRKSFYHDLKDGVYETMIAGAERVPAGSRGVIVDPSFSSATGAGITGLTSETTRDEIYRAALEALAMRLERGRKALEKAGSFSTGEIICVGGGSRNRLWNQLRADATGTVIRAIDKTETTVLGASFFVSSAVGNTSSPEEAREAVKYEYTDFVPRNK